MSKYLILGGLLLTAACTTPSTNDLSTPEGRYRDARQRAVVADIWKDAADSWKSVPTYTAPRMTVCTPAAGGVLICQ